MSTNEYVFKLQLVTEYVLRALSEKLTPVCLQMQMSAVPFLVRCAEMDGVLMKLAPSSVYVMKAMNLLQMARTVQVCT